jgi:hypothetical protein
VPGVGVGGGRGGSWAPGGAAFPAGVHRMQHGSSSSSSSSKSSSSSNNAARLLPSLAALDPPPEPEEEEEYKTHSSSSKSHSPPYHRIAVDTAALATLACAAGIEAMHQAPHSGSGDLREPGWPPAPHSSARVHEHMMTAATKTTTTTTTTAAAAVFGRWEPYDPVMARHALQASLLWVCDPSVVAPSSAAAAKQRRRQQQTVHLQQVPDNLDADAAATAASAAAHHHGSGDAAAPKPRRIPERVHEPCVLPNDLH